MEHSSSTHDVTDLTHHQTKAVSDLCRLPHAFCIAKVGTGKTIIGLTYLEARKRYFRRDFKTLLVAPVRVARGVWPFEPDLWGHISLSVAACESPYKIDEDADIITISYESLPGFINKHYDLIASGYFEVAIFDEIHRMKSPRSVRFAGRKRPRQFGWKDVQSFFQNVIGMTGTPKPHSLLDLWGQVSTVAGPDKLFGSFENWRDTRFFLCPGDAAKPVHAQRYLPFDEKTILKDFEDITVYVGVEDDAVPDAIQLEPIVINPDIETKKKYKQLLRQAYLAIKDQEITAINAAVLHGKLRQFTAGHVYDEEGEPAMVHTFKYDCFDEIYKQARAAGEKIIAVYAYRTQREELKRKYPNALDLAVSSDPTADIHRWNDNSSYNLLSLHPKSASEGLNLQYSGCKLIVFLTDPHSIGQLEQTVGRLARRRASSSPVRYVSIHLEGTVDSLVSERLSSMKEVLDRVIDHIKEGGA